MLRKAKSRWRVAYSVVRHWSVHAGCTRRRHRSQQKHVHFHTKRSTSLVGDLVRDQRESLEHSRAQTRGPAYRLCLLALQVSSQNNELIDLPIAQREIAQKDQWFR